MDKRYLISTEDGTSTLFLEEYGQAMHSLSGAYEESLLKHIIPSRILEHDSASVFVLDVGFGIGYNVLALMHQFISLKKNSTLEIISLEKDKFFSEFMNAVKFNDSRDMIYDFIKDVYSSGEGNYSGVNLKIIFDDARNYLKNVSDYKFSAIFQDPFSPSKNPELWSFDYFLLLKKLISENGILTTYSSADHIRRAMIEAGFNIGRGPSVGKKREGTIASPGNIYNKLGEDEKQLIFSNIRSIPYTDPELSFSRDTILQTRLDTIHGLKNSFK